MHFDTLDDLLAALPALATEHRGELAGRSAQFLLQTKQGRSISIALTDGCVTVAEGSCPAPDCTIHADEGDLLAMIGGALNPMKAILLGRVRIRGDAKPLMELIALLH